MSVHLCVTWWWWWRGSNHQESWSSLVSGVKINFCSLRSESGQHWGNGRHKACIMQLSTHLYPGGWRCCLLTHWHLASQKIPMLGFVLLFWAQRNMLLQDHTAYRDSLFPLQSVASSKQTLGSWWMSPQVLDRAISTKWRISSSGSFPISLRLGLKGHRQESVLFPEHVFLPSVYLLLTSAMTVVCSLTLRFREDKHFA